MATKIDTSEERIAETWEEAIFLAHLDHALLVGSEIVIPWLSSPGNILKFLSVESCNGPSP